MAETPISSRSPPGGGFRVCANILKSASAKICPTAFGFWLNRNKPKRRNGRLAYRFLHRPPAGRADSAAVDPPGAFASTKTDRVAGLKTFRRARGRGRNRQNQLGVRAAKNLLRTGSKRRRQLRRSLRPVDRRA